MTHIQPDLEETRCKEHRNSPFFPSPLFHSQLVKEGEEPLKKALQIKPGLWALSHQSVTKEGHLESAPMVDIPLQVATSHIP